MRSLQLATTAHQIVTLRSLQPGSSGLANNLIAWRGQPMNSTSNRNPDHSVDRPERPDFSRLAWLLQGNRESVTVERDTMAGGLVSNGLPSGHFRTFTELDRSLFWFPSGVPDGRSLLLASSRIGRRPEQKSGLFDAIRTVACRFDSRREFLITHDAMATHPYLVRAARLYDLPLVEFKPLPTSIDERWLQLTWDACRGHLAQRDIPGCLCYYRLSSDVETMQRDQFMMRLAWSLRLLSVSARGNCFHGAIHRLRHDPADTFLLVDRSLTSARITEQLCDAGAVRWWLYSRAGEIRLRPPGHAARSCLYPPSSVSIDWTSTCSIGHGDAPGPGPGKGPTSILMI